MYKGSNFSVSSPTLIAHENILGILAYVQWDLIMVLTCITLVTKVFSFPVAF